MGILLLSGVGNAGGYSNKLLSLFGSSLIDYSIMGETSGTVAVDSSPLASNGAYTGVTLGQAGIGDGRTCPLFDGTSGFNNRFTAARATAFSALAGTKSIWARVADVGVWTDGAARVIWRSAVDANNQVYIVKPSTNNLLQAFYIGGGVSKGVQLAVSTTEWFHIGVTWSISGDLLALYINAGAPNTASTMPTWSGTLATDLVGSFNTTPVQPWSGWLAHAAAATRAATAGEIAVLAAR